MWLTRLRRWLRRQRARWYLISDSAEYLSRRVMVENYLIGVSHGTKPPVTPEVARHLALHLAVPADSSGFRSLKKRLEVCLPIETETP